jgi:hypothetical protein
MSLMKSAAAVCLAAATALMLAQTGAQVQTKNNISMYYSIYPVTVTGVTLPGQVPAGTGQAGVSVSVQSSDTTVTGFVVTLTYVAAADGSTQSTIHKFAAVAGDYATEAFPVGAVTSVTAVGVIPTIDQQEVVFTTAPPSTVSKDRVSRRNQ